MPSRTPLRDTAEWALGRRAEDAVVELCRALDWYVTRSADFSGPTGEWRPEMQGRYGGLVLPDADVARRGRSCYVEVKAKTYTPEHRKLGIRVHGFADRLYRQYLDVELVTGRPVWLWVCEADSGAVLAAWVADLEPDSLYRDPAGEKFDGVLMAFFDRRRFARMGSWDPDTGVAVAQVAFDGDPGRWNPDGGGWH